MLLCAMYFFADPQTTSLSHIGSICSRKDFVGFCRTRPRILSLGFATLPWHTFALPAKASIKGRQRAPWEVDKRDGQSPLPPLFADSAGAASDHSGEVLQVLGDVEVAQPGVARPRAAFLRGAFVRSGEGRFPQITILRGYGDRPFG